MLQALFYEAMTNDFQITGDALYICISTYEHTYVQYAYMLLSQLVKDQSKNWACMVRYSCLPGEPLARDYYKWHPEEQTLCDGSCHPGKSNYTRVLIGSILC